MSDGKQKLLVEKLRGAGRRDFDELADELEKATDGFFGTPQTVSVAKFVGTWARARRFWCDFSGESII